MLDVPRAGVKGARVHYSAAMARILAILNLTRDSYSDGGRFFPGGTFAPERALEAAARLVADGAARIDAGAESTHPDSEDVTAAEELRRLEPVVSELVARGIEVSVDTTKPEVMRRAIQLGASCVNDVAALREPGALEAVAAGRCDVILMHSTSPSARAERSGERSGDWIARIGEFFDRRVEACSRAGIARERLIVDPGLGFFLSRDPGPSLEVLARLDELRRRLGLPLCLSPSRKSFLGALLGREVGDRGAASLAAELWCAAHGVEWIRAHDVRPLADALKVVAAIEGARARG
jgi:dihydropteroate synthase type 2